MPQKLAKLALLAALAVGLGLKTLAFANMGEANWDTPGLDPTVAAFFNASGFAITMPVAGTNPLWADGTRGDCTIRIAAVAPTGASQDIVEEQADGQRLYYTLSGKLYTDEPVVEATFMYYERRLLNGFGISNPELVVRAIILGDDCPDSALNDPTGKLIAAATL
ncbi:MAG TPA: hypothetical protein VL418_05130 [Devosiaceae bacterium]|nr:hypothetical protein [Devosiaceae bacterium]